MPETMTRCDASAPRTSKYRDTYEELRTIGSGHSGVCVLLRERRTNELAVVKKLACTNVGSEAQLKSAQHEVEVLASLQCPNVINYIESFVEDSTFHIVMEYATDGSLANQVQLRREKGSCFKDSEITNIFMQLLLAIEHCHNLKVLHRDLKTENVFMNSVHGPKSLSVGKGALVKLGDFGVARVMGSLSLHALSIVGTPNSMSPEQVEGKPYNEKSDVWSLGCILYEMCTLRRPFVGSSLMQVVYAIAAGKYSPIPDEVNPFFKGLIEQMLTVDPDARPSISQMHKLVQKKWGSPELWDKLNMNAGKSYADVYEEIRPLGKGQFGIVVLVRRRADSVLLAVKKIPSAKFGDWRQRESCHSEVKLLMQLEHLNIVSYIESFEEGGVLHLVTEYAECGSLMHLIEHRKKAEPQGFSQEEVLDLLMQIMLALEYLHTRKVLHRDLTPANIFISYVVDTAVPDMADSNGKEAQNGVAHVIKLGDFGFARQLSTSTVDVKTIVGTPFYMSPELVQGSGYNDKSDVWALGCIAYELIMLEKPFSGNNLPQVVLKIAKGHYAPLPSHVSEELSHLVASMLTVDPSKRPTVSQMLSQPIVRSTRARIQGKLDQAAIKQNKLAPIRVRNRPPVGYQDSAASSSGANNSCQSSNTSGSSGAVMKSRVFSSTVWRTLSPDESTLHSSMDSLEYPPDFEDYEDGTVEEEKSPLTRMLSAVHTLEREDSIQPIAFNGFGTMDNLEQHLTGQLNNLDFVGGVEDDYLVDDEDVYETSFDVSRALDSQLDSTKW